MINVPEIFITNDGGREKCKSRRPQLEVLEGGYSCSPVGNQDDYVWAICILWKPEAGIFPFGLIRIFLYKYKYIY